LGKSAEIFGILLMALLISSSTPLLIRAEGSSYSVQFTESGAPSDVVMFTYATSPSGIAQCQNNLHSFPQEVTVPANYSFEFCFYNIGTANSLYRLVSVEINGVVENETGTLLEGVCQVGAAQNLSGWGGYDCYPQVDQGWESGVNGSGMTISATYLMEPVYHFAATYYFSAVGLPQGANALGISPSTSPSSLCSSAFNPDMPCEPNHAFPFSISGPASEVVQFNFFPIVIGNMIYYPQSASEQTVLTSTNQPEQPCPSSETQGCFGAEGPVYFDCTVYSPNIGCPSMTNSRAGGGIDPGPALTDSSITFIQVVNYSAAPYLVPFSVSSSVPDQTVLSDQSLIYTFQPPNPNNALVYNFYPSLNTSKTPESAKSCIGLCGFWNSPPGNFSIESGRLTSYENGTQLTVGGMRSAGISSLWIPVDSVLTVRFPDDRIQNYTGSPVSGRVELIVESGATNEPSYLIYLVLVVLVAVVTFAAYYISRMRSSRKETVGVRPSSTV